MQKINIYLPFMNKTGREWRRVLPRLLMLPLFLLLAVQFSACATRDKPTRPAKEYFDSGANFMDKKQYQSAIEQFSQIKTLHPLSPYVQMAELEIISAYYGLGDYEEADYYAQRFIGFYPDARQQDFAYYMAARSQYARGLVVLDRFDKRDLRGAQDAYASFQQLVSLFPNSEYVPESYAHMRHIRNILAKNELDNAEFYFNRFSYVATINRCLSILQNFPGSPYSLEALRLMEEAYRKLGWDDQAEIVAAVYEENAALYDE